VPEEELPEGVQIESVAVVGEFNNWVSDASPMSRCRGGLYRADVELEKGKEYQFRYLLNGEEWYNDWYADAYVPGGMGGENCVVSTLTA
jgi:1,4-alpha-glucan branching enzyme